MSATKNYMVQVTNGQGHPAHPVQMREPEPGSVVLTEGEFGTAWQRHFADGLWHSTRGGGPKPWLWLSNKRNLVLVYDAEARR